MNPRAINKYKRLAERFQRVSDLWSVYYAKSSVGPDVFGEEFFHAVGSLLQGKETEQLELTHIDPNDLGKVIHVKKRSSRKS